MGFESEAACLLEDCHAIVEVKASKEVCITLRSWYLLPSFRDFIEGWVELSTHNIHHEDWTGV